MNSTHSLFTRRSFALFVIFSVGICIFGRAFYCQVLQRDFLVDQGTDRFQRTLTAPALRGMIQDRNGEPLAVSSPMDSIWADPKLLINYVSYFPALAKALNEDSIQLSNRITKKSSSRFIWLKRQMTPEEVARVQRLGLPGVYVKREYRRYYPNAEVTSHILGYTDLDDKGQEGLELLFNSSLTGIEGKREVIRDRYNRTIEIVRDVSLPQPGEVLQLSIDRRLQYLAYRALKAKVTETGAVTGSAVMVDAWTGEILALVNQPAGNPNNRDERTGELLRNRAITDTFEPGSLAKPFVVAMGLEYGNWKPTTPVDTSPGKMQIGNYTVRDIHSYGLINVATVILKSSNIGVVKIANSLPTSTLEHVYKSVGFGSKALGYPGEQAGYLPKLSKLGKFEFATTTFGYGFSVTPLQLAHAYTVFANRGVLMPLTLVKRKEGDSVQGKRIFSEKTAKAMIDMMTDVVQHPGGTAKRARVPGYLVAGKTGTARKLVNGRYAPDKHRSVFSGIVPADNPRYVMVIMIDEPNASGSYYGGAVAAPVFSDMMGSALRILNIDPSIDGTYGVEAVAKNKKKKKKP